MGVALGRPAVLAAGPALDQFLALGWETNFAIGLKPNDPFVLVLAVAALPPGGIMRRVSSGPPRRRASIPWRRCDTSEAFQRGWQ